MNIGLVHDTLLDLRGPERTFESIASIWPEAPIYTLVYDDDSTDGIFAQRRVWSGLGEGRRVRRRGIGQMRSAFPRGARRLPVWEHDVVVSSSTGFSVGVQPREDAVHVSYIHRLGESGPERVTDFVANSQLTRQRIQEAWGRDSAVIHPPVEVERFTIEEPDDYFLVVAELSPHKHVEVACEAARLAGKRLIVVGSGLEYRKLHREYGRGAEFVRRLRDEEMNTLFARAQALIVGTVEDFGIAAVEAQAAGRPVVGLAAGGLLETVVDGQTGVLVPAEGGAGALAEALRETDFGRFSPAAIREHAQPFSRARFERELEQHVARVVAAQ